MSRIGRDPVYFEKGVQVTVSPDGVITVKGAKHSQVLKMRSEVTAKVEGDKVVLTRKDDEAETRALHGMYRALLSNAVKGVSKGFSRDLELVGVGYRAAIKGKQLELTLGYSHPIAYNIPEGVEIKVDKQINISVSGANKQLVGQVAAEIRDFRPPEPYLGKGVKYANEQIRRKAGKAAGK